MKRDPILDTIPRDVRLAELTPEQRAAVDHRAIDIWIRSVLHVALKRVLRREDRRRARAANTTTKESQ